MKRGPKAKPDVLKVLRGTFRPCRASAPLVPPDLEGEPVTPAWLKGAALRIFEEKLSIYAARGQLIRGKEGPLAQYCAVEAHLIDLWEQKIDVPVALINAHRVYANEFFDTPAESLQGPRANAPGNRFASNGQRQPRPINKP